MTEKQKPETNLVPLELFQLQDHQLSHVPIPSV